MAVLTLADLPSPPPGRSGWPWTEASEPLPSTAPGGVRWPGIAIVTPSMNQGAYLEAAIRSVLLQGYPNLEYVIMDGGSTDGSRELIERYAPFLTSWTSEPDGGQYEAITRGHTRTSGHLMAWINSDDLYLPGAFRAVAEAFISFEPFTSMQWLTTTRPFRIDGNGEPYPARPLPGFSRQCFWRGEYVIGIRPLWSAWIPQESTFWTRTLWRRVGASLRSDLDLAADDLLGVSRRRQRARQTCSSGQRTEFSPRNRRGIFEVLSPVPQRLFVAHRRSPVVSLHAEGPPSLWQLALNSGADCIQTRGGCSLPARV